MKIAAAFVALLASATAFMAPVPRMSRRTVSMVSGLCSVCVCIDSARLLCASWDLD